MGEIETPPDSVNMTVASRRKRLSNADYRQREHLTPSENIERVI
jgi:hypothetical protein